MTFRFRAPFAGATQMTTHSAKAVLLNIQERAYTSPIWYTPETGS